jgi:hypothetical protein
LKERRHAKEGASAPILNLLCMYISDSSTNVCEYVFVAT